MSRGTKRLQSGILDVGHFANVFDKIFSKRTNVEDEDFKCRLFSWRFFFRQNCKYCNACSDTAKAIMTKNCLISCLLHFENNFSIHIGKCWYSLVNVCTADVLVKVCLH